jgi:hypothetical protein
MNQVFLSINSIPVFVDRSSIEYLNAEEGLKAYLKALYQRKLEEAKEDPLFSEEDLLRLFRPEEGQSPQADAAQEGGDELHKGKLIHTTLLFTNGISVYNLSVLNDTSCIFI